MGLFTKKYCIDCGIRTQQQNILGGDASEFQDGLRCPECTREYRQKKIHKKNTTA